MTPLQISLLMRLYEDSAEEAKRPLDGTEVEAFLWLLRKDMVVNRDHNRSGSIIMPVTLNQHALTARGRCYVDAVIALPLPGRRSEWVMPS